MQYPLSTKIFIAGILFAILTLLVVGAHFLFVEDVSTKYNEASASIAQLKDDAYQEYFIAHIDTFFKEEGINGMIQRVVRALGEDQITMFVCHSLAHDIGHYGGYPDNYSSVGEFLTKENLDFCGSGFMHGVEAQLANGPYPQSVQDLYEFCKRVLPFEPYYYGCYHGAGHTFMENAKDPETALKQCDLLRTDEVTGPTHCYRGVFSEHANLVHRLGKDETYLLAYCSSLPVHLQFHCAEELNGLEIPTNVTDKEIERALEICTDTAYAVVIQRGCVRSVATIAADHLIGQGRELLPLPLVHTFSFELIKEYIHGMHGSFVKTAQYDQSLSLETFCSAFTKQEATEYCNDLRRGAL